MVFCLFNENIVVNDLECCLLWSSYGSLRGILKSYLCMICLDAFAESLGNGILIPEFGSALLLALRKCWLISFQVAFLI